MQTMKSVLQFVLFVLLFRTAGAQDADPVSWQYSVKQINAQTCEVYFTAIIQAGWHIYAQQQPKDAVAAPTAIRFMKNPLVVIKGSPAEIGKKSKQFVEELDITQYYYADRVDFVQTIQLKNKVRTALSATVSYIACTDSRCLPEKTLSFSIKVPGN